MGRIGTELPIFDVRNTSPLLTRIQFCSGSRLCENASEPRTLRIVFSIALCQRHLPVRLVSAATKSRWNFYALVQRLSFHAAWVKNGIVALRRDVCFGPVSGHRRDCLGMAEKC